MSRSDSLSLTWDQLVQVIDRELDTLRGTLREAVQRSAVVQAGLVASPRNEIQGSSSRYRTERGSGSSQFQQVRRTGIGRFSSHTPGRPTARVAAIRACVSK